MKKWYSLFTFVLLCGATLAQNNLTLEQAVAAALKNNIGILVATNDQEIAALTSHAGNAGMLPIVNLNATASTGSTNSLQEFANGTVQERNNAKSNGINAGLGATWVIFDGMRMFATREKLNELETMGELQLRNIIENSIEQISIAYYNAERLREQYEIYKNSLQLYLERENLAKIRLESGKGNRAEYLQATVERTTQENLLLQLQLERNNALLSLGTYMGVVSDSAALTADSLTMPSYPATMMADINNNTELMLAEKGIAIAQLEQREISSDYFPRISIGGSYNFINNNNQAGFVLLNRNYGYSGLINFSWTIFSGNTTRINTRIARIQVESRELLKKETELVLRENYQRAFGQYALSLQQIQSEQNNMTIANENLTLSMDRYREGKSTLIEVREAQKYADDIRVRLVNAMFNARSAEVMMKRIKGELITTSN